jgi:uncharacterized protein YydD (DUF2326 family)
MFLRKLYSEPSGLFHPEPVIVFKDGINFIFGRKDKESDSKDSLNGIGKSLLLDFIDFCLLSSIPPRIRLAEKEELIKEYKIVLEFEIDGKFYILKRSIDTPNKNIEFGEIGGTRLYGNTDSDHALKELLCDLVFRNNDYPGKYYNTWFRKLMPFFSKIQSPKKEKFSDPVQYMAGPSVMELYQYHLFFMGIDNTISYRNFEIQANIKQREPVIGEIERFIQEAYGYKNIDDATAEIDKIARDIKNLESAITEFKLRDEYADVEKEANLLTAKIKDLWFQNFSDRKKIENYTDSFKADANIDTTKVEKLYKEVNQLLSDKIKTTLDSAIKFREELSKSRKSFLSKEIKSIQSSIEKREGNIKELDDNRAKLFNFLATKEAIKDLSDAYLQLSQKREMLNELEGKIRLYNDFVREKAELKTEEASLFAEMLTFLEEIKKEISSVRSVFTKIYNSIYMENKDESKFTLTANERYDSKLRINISFPADLSKGKNQGRTLVYDLAILFHAIENGIKLPRFLIHDGIFDGMYKGQFVHLYEYLTSLKDTVRFQYIVTLNEEGTLNDRFGKIENLTPEKISEEAIINLTPACKLLGKAY